MAAAGQTFTQGGSLGTGVTAFTSLDMVTHDIWANNPMDPRIADLRTNILMPEQISVTINTPTQVSQAESWLPSQLWFCATCAGLDTPRICDMAHMPGVGTTEWDRATVL